MAGPPSGCAFPRPPPVTGPSDRLAPLGPPKRVLSPRPSFSRSLLPSWTARALPWGVAELSWEWRGAFCVASALVQEELEMEMSSTEGLRWGRGGWGGDDRGVVLEGTEYRSPLKTLGV